MATGPRAWTDHADKDHLLNITRGIWGGFVWSDTPEGFEYWDAINKRVIAMIKELKAARGGIDNGRK